MNGLERTALGAALAERVQALARTNARLRALDEDSWSEPHRVAEADPEAVLRGALLALSDGAVLASARRLVAGESSDEAELLARAGLAVWDPSTESPRATMLLIELMRMFEAAIREAEGSR